MTRRAIRFQRAFVILDLVFCLAPRTVNVLVEPLGAGLLHVRHDKTGIDALVADFDLDNHAARARPGSGLITRRVEAGDLAPIALIGPFGLLDHVTRQGLQDGIAGQTGDITSTGKPPPLAVRLAEALPFRRAQGSEERRTLNVRPPAYGRGLPDTYPGRAGLWRGDMARMTSCASANGSRGFV